MSTMDFWQLYLLAHWEGFFPLECNKAESFERNNQCVALYCAIINWIMKNRRRRGTRNKRLIWSGLMQGWPNSKWCLPTITGHKNCLLKLFGMQKVLSREVSFNIDIVLDNLQPDLIYCKQKNTCSSWIVYMHGLVMNMVTHQSDLLWYSGPQQDCCPLNHPSQPPPIFSR